MIDLPLSMGDALDLWLARLPSPAAGDCRATPLSWWLFRCGPLMWRGHVISVDLGMMVEMRTILAEDHDNPDLRFAYMVPIPLAWNQGGVQ